MTKDEIDALDAVIRYLWDDEQRDFGRRHGDEVTDHVFRHLTTLQNYTQNVKETK